MPAEAWWNELNLELQIFYGIAAVAVGGLMLAIFWLMLSRLRFFSLWIGVTTSLCAQEIYPTIVTLKNREYTNVTVLSVEPDGLRVRHESGTAKLFFTDLPDEIRKKHGYDPDVAAAHRKAADEKARAMENALTAAINDMETNAPTPPPAPEARAAQGPQASASPAPVKLFAQTTSAGATQDHRWKTSWGSYDRDVYRERYITITMRSETGGPATVETHWIGSRVGERGGNDVVLTNKDEVTLKPGGVANVITSGGLFVESDAKYAALGIRERSGIKYSGWVVRVIDKNGRVLAVQGSRPPLIALVK